MGEHIETILCFGASPEIAPGCAEVMIAWWLAVVAAGLYEFVVLPIHACREVHEQKIPYTQALWHTFSHQCFCFKICAEKCCVAASTLEHRDESKSMQADGTVL